MMAAFRLTSKTVILNQGYSSCTSKGKQEGKVM